MTDQQLMTLALAIIIPFSMLLNSNSRITEAKETLRAELKLSHAEILAAIEKMGGEMKIDILRIENKLDHYAETLASHSERLDGLERRGGPAGSFS